MAFPGPVPQLSLENVIVPPVPAMAVGRRHVSGPDGSQRHDQLHDPSTFLYFTPRDCRVLRSRGMWR
ncbi:hypothetical protein M413DRAFT_438562 [Hebeloma cylindrosporum]|uniref:Uncharacterized protein n=1 Tax=Hebeloma cylindrosporum TaxID=76867 RepID=A0A0C2YHV8_HEBCY|nr:hypothetical protein M413DRAFT_438562 [Hebeloma cylindrosporum h7]